jgi:hypothetical protein
METPRIPDRPGAAGETRDNEVRRRAALLASLGFSKARAEARLRQNFVWEHERLGKPAILKRLAALVAEAYQQAGVTKKK